jgi:hypothetical protein
MRGGFQEGRRSLVGRDGRVAYRSTDAACSSRTVYLIEAYWLPRSLLWTSPPRWSGRRSCRACSSASSPKPADANERTRFSRGPKRRIGRPTFTASPFL